MSDLSRWFKKALGIPETRIEATIAKKDADRFFDGFANYAKEHGLSPVTIALLRGYMEKALGKYIAMLILILLPLGAWAAVIPFATGAEYIAKHKTAVAGDVLQATADFALPISIIIPRGVVLDLNEKTVEFPKGVLGFCMLSGSRLLNGTVANAMWGVVTWDTTDDLQIKKVTFKDITGCVIKLGANGTGPTTNVLIEDVKANMAGTNPASLMDIGPAKTSGIVVRRCYLRGIENPVNNTANDGIAVENGTTQASGEVGITIEDTTVESVGGDGIDCKGVAKLRNVLIKDATRNSVKLWRGGTMEKVSVVHCGFGGVSVQPLTATDCYLEAGYLGGTAWTVDDQGFGVPNSTFTRCAFTRKAGDGAGVLMTADLTPELNYVDCRFWNGPVEKPYYANFYLGKWTLVMMGKAPTWPATWVRPVYADTDPPTDVGFGGVPLPPTDPPVVDPPPPPTTIYATRVEMEGQIAVLKALIEAEAAARAALVVRLKEALGG